MTGYHDYLTGGTVSSMNYLPRDVSLYVPEHLPARTGVVPDGVTILSRQRAGRTGRDATVEHLNQMEAMEFLTPEEAETRRQYALAAETYDQLNILTADLPPRALTRRLPAPLPRTTEFRVRLGFTAWLIAAVWLLVPQVVFTYDWTGGNRAGWSGALATVGCGVLGIVAFLLGVWRWVEYEHGRS